MIFKAFTVGMLLLSTSATHASGVQSLIDQAMKDLEVKASDKPYSRVIERMFIGYDADGNPKVGIAQREIESFKPITGIVVVHKTADGFVLHEAIFPDIGKIDSSKDRKQVLSILKQFKKIPFDPHAEKSAVDGLTGATRHGIKTSGYLNYMARRIALEMEAKPDW
ncbi:MAG: hypothetical protein DRP64_15965 [Verrucomicrobia bacterium]|nr:MAG: hypothetical protein DRP64_15965 [Verrucomicrobiota bacterium]